MNEDRLRDEMPLKVYSSTGRSGYVRFRNGSLIAVPWYIPIRWWFRNLYCEAWLWLLKRGILTKMAEIDEYNSANREKP